jgi:hypothetical protein
MQKFYKMTLFFSKKKLVNEIDEYSEIFYFYNEIFKFN